MSDPQSLRPLTAPHAPEQPYDESMPTPPAIMLRAAGLSWADAFGQPFDRLSGDGMSVLPDSRPLLDWIDGATRPAGVSYAVVVVDVVARPESVLDVFAQPERTEPLRLAFVLERLREMFQTEGEVATLSSRRCVVVTPASRTLPRHVAALSESLADLGRVRVVDLPSDVAEAQALVRQLEG